MVEAQPVVNVVIFIACGVLAFFIGFIFAKRQIFRFALKNSRKPHVYVGTDAPPELQSEIKRRLKRTKDIKYEPSLINAGNTDEQQTGNQLYNRERAMDATHLLKKQYMNSDFCAKKTSHSLCDWLVEMKAGPLKTASRKLLLDFSRIYFHARHSPADFGANECDQYMELLEAIETHLKQSKALSVPSAIFNHDTNATVTSSPKGSEHNIAPTNTSECPRGNIEYLPLKAGLSQSHASLVSRTAHKRDNETFV